MGEMLKPGDEYYSSPEDMVEILDLSANSMIYTDEKQYPDSSDYVLHTPTNSDKSIKLLNQRSDAFIVNLVDEIKRLRILLYKHAIHIPDIAKEKDKLDQRAHLRKQKQLEKLLINN